VLVVHPTPRGRQQPRGHSALEAAAYRAAGRPTVHEYPKLIAAFARLLAAERETVRLRNSLLRAPNEAGEEGARIALPSPPR
jgi:hypothetical protein